MARPTPRILAQISLLFALLAATGCRKEVLGPRGDWAIIPPEGWRIAQGRDLADLPGLVRSTSDGRELLLILHPLEGPGFAVNLELMAEDEPLDLSARDATEVLKTVATATKPPFVFDGGERMERKEGRFLRVFVHVEDATPACRQVIYLYPRKDGRYVLRGSAPDRALLDAFLPHFDAAAASFPRGDPKSRRWLQLFYSIVTGTGLGILIVCARRFHRRRTERAG